VAGATRVNALLLQRRIKVPEPALVAAAAIAGLLLH
jgi:hypothetical protein